MDNDQQPGRLEREQQPTKQMAALRVDEVRAKRSQVRKSFSDIAALASSILQEGQIQPIVVSSQNSEGYYIIQQGERRWRACQQAGLTKIDAIINPPKASELDEIAGELIENIQREALAPLEIANALHCFVQQGWKQKAIAERLGKTSSFVSTHLSLLKMADGVEALYQANITRDPETLNNLRQLYDLEPQTGQNVCQAALQDGISRQHSREVLNDAKRAAGKAPRVSKRPRSSPEILAEEAPLPEVTPAMDPVPLEPLITGLTTLESDRMPAVVINEAPARLAELTPAEAEMAQSSLVETASAAAISTGSLPSVTGWRIVPAEVLRIIVNILSEADFQQGILMTDRVDHQADHSWVKICRVGQEKLIRVPVADIELVRLEVLVEE